MIITRCGDCAEVLRELDDNSVDSLVTDPPSGIGFMGKDWDSNKGGRDQWIDWLSGIMREAMRAMKPGSHGLVWSLPRTSHWTGMALENAGFEVRDTIAHIFASGFVQGNLDLGKYVEGGEGGWGTLMKRSHETWWLIKKPNPSGMSTSETHQQYRTAGLNIDGCRVPYNDKNSLKGKKIKVRNSGQIYGGNSFQDSATRGDPDGQPCHPKGRWPTNLIWTDPPKFIEDAGYYPCFKYCPKPGRAERDAGLGHKPLTRQRTMNEGGIQGRRDNNAERAIEQCQGVDARGRTLIREDGSKTLVDRFIPQYRANNHPTLKSIELMRWLCRLVTPPGGVVLDPFMGSGSTGCGAVLEGFGFYGIELDPGHAENARDRIEWHRLKATRVIDKDEELDSNGKPKQMGLF